MRKFIASLVSVAIGAGIVSGCSGTGSSGQAARTPEYVSADSLWYDSERVELVDMTGCTGWGSRSGTNDGLVYTDGEKFLIEEDFTYGYGSNEEEVRKLELIDKTGECLMSLDLSNDSWSDISTYFVSDDQIFCLTEQIDYSGSTDWYLSCVRDADGNMGNREDRTEIPELGRIITSENVLGCIEETDGLVRMCFTSWNGGAKMIDIEQDLSVNCTDITVQLQSAGMTSCYSMARCSDTHYVLSGCDLSGDNISVVYNEITGEVTAVTDETALSRLNSGMGTSVCYSDSYGVCRFNPETMQYEQMFSFNDCNINRYQVERMTPVYSDDEHTVLWGITDNGRNGQSMMIFDLTKAPSNPNEGKVVLLAASLQGGMDPATAEGIYLYNQTSDTALIRMDDRYDTNGFSESMYYNTTAELILSEDFVREFNSEYSDMSNRLTIDILAGEGPDIILNGYAFPQLENDRCLIDLTGRTAQTDAARYFCPVLSNSAYQLPYSVGLSGICYDPSKAPGEVPVAPDYEEYGAFVDDVCNGNDPLLSQNGRLRVFLLLFRNMYDSLYGDDGCLHLDNDDFRAMAEYCRDLPEESTFLSGGNAPRYAHYNENIYWGDLSDGQTALMGLPSSAGTGPRLSIRCSAAISSTCPDVDAAWSFIETLMSDEVQASTYQNGAYSVNREICRNAVLAAIEENNLMAEGYANSDEPFVQGPAVISEAVADAYIEALDNALPSVNVDPDILIVADEEIQAYFAGDKTIDEVITLMQDRCNTILNEKAT